MTAKPVWAIAACGSNGVIGAAGGLPWKIAEDWEYLLDMIKGGIVINGRRCYEEAKSLGGGASGTLPGVASTVVISTTLDPALVTDATVVASLDEALTVAQSLPGSKIWIGGGRRVYAEAFKDRRVARLYLTEIKTAFEGDVAIPEDWQDDFPTLVSSHCSHDMNHEFDFNVYSRRTTGT